jgi:dTDP-glucose 4,6-dehydratase
MPHSCALVQALILRCTNNFGAFQFPEKLIPLVITNVRQDKPVPIYRDGLQERDWLFVEDFCQAIALALDNVEPGSVYNVSAGTPQPNLGVVQTILQHLGKPESLVQFVQDRPGHDRRYALDSSRIRRELAWSPKLSFKEGIRRTIEWYQANSPWLDHALSGEYRNFYHRNYTRRSNIFRA